MKKLERSKALQFKTKFNKLNDKHKLIHPYIFYVSYKDKDSNLPKYSFTFSQLCVVIYKKDFLTNKSFYKIKSFHWVGRFSVGGLVVGDWLVGGWWVCARWIQLNAMIKQTRLRYFH